MATKKKTIKETKDFDSFEKFLKPPKEDNEISSQEEQKINYFESVMSEIFSIRNIDVRSNITRDMVLPLAVGRTLASRFGDNKILNDYIDNIMTFSISVGRGSRNDMVEISKGLYPQEGGDEMQRRVASDRFMGKRR